MIPRRVVYIAGPFRADNAWERELNIRRAEEVALAVWKAGMAAVCPHTNGRFFEGAAPVENYLEGDLAIIDRCDAVLFVGRWEHSKGSVGEYKYARDNGVPCFFSLDGLMAWEHDVAGLKRPGAVQEVRRG